MGVGKSIRQSLRDGEAIGITSIETFGKSGSVFSDHYIDRYTMVTGATQFSFFAIARNAEGKTDADTNSVAKQVPAGQRWDLEALTWFIQSPNGAAMTQAQKAAWNLFLAGLSYKLSFGNQLIRDEPAWGGFGSQMAQEEAITPTLALSSPVPAPASWKEYFAEECYLPLSQNVIMTFDCKCASIPAALSGFKIGVAFDRTVAFLT